MSRSGYSDECDSSELFLWRSTVERAMYGKRGQLFLLELLAALDALPVKELITEDLVNPEGAVCALGAVGKFRGIDMAGIDCEDTRAVGAAFKIPRALVAEIEFFNDEEYYRCSPAERWELMRRWVLRELRDFVP